MTYIYIKKVNDRNYSIDFTQDVRDFICSKPLGLKLALEVILPNRSINKIFKTVKNNNSNIITDKKILKKKRKIALASKN